MAVTVQITTPAAGATLTTGQNLVRVIVGGTDPVTGQNLAAYQIMQVHALIRRQGDMPEDVSHIPGDATFLNKQGEPAGFHFEGNWVNCPQPPPGQQWAVQIRAWARIQSVAGVQTIACTVNGPPMMPPP